MDLITPLTLIPYSVLYTRRIRGLARETALLLRVLRIQGLIQLQWRTGLFKGVIPANWKIRTGDLYGVHL